MGFLGHTAIGLLHRTTLLKLLLAQFPSERHLQQSPVHNLLLSVHQIVHAPLGSNGATTQKLGFLTCQPNRHTTNKLGRVLGELLKGRVEHVCLDQTRVQRDGRKVGVSGRKVGHQLLAGELAGRIGRHEGNDDPRASCGYIDERGGGVWGRQGRDKRLSEEKCAFGVDFLLGGLVIKSLGFRRCLEGQKGDGMDVGE